LFLDYGKIKDKVLSVDKRDSFQKIFNLIETRIDLFFIKKINFTYDLENEIGELVNFNYLRLFYEYFHDEYKQLFLLFEKKKTQ